MSEQLTGNLSNDYFVPATFEKLAMIGFDDLDEIFRVRIFSEKNVFDMLPSKFYSTTYTVKDGFIHIKGMPVPLKKAKIQLVANLNVKNMIVRE